MPDVGDRRASDDVGDAILWDWEKRPFPRTLAEFEKGVNEWLAEAWGADWCCPHCKNRWWFVLEAVNLSGAASWPVGDGSSATGSYTVVPIACSRCRWLALVSVKAIFEEPPPPVRGPVES